MQEVVRGATTTAVGTRTIAVGTRTWVAKKVCAVTMANNKNYFLGLWPVNRDIVGRVAAKYF